MFTVIAAEQYHLDYMQEFKAFLEPFLKNKNVAICRWIPEGDTLKDAMPSLQETIQGHDRWRMVVLTEEEGIARRNPFDLATMEKVIAPNKTDDTAADLERLEEYLEKKETAKIAAYKEASEKSLTRLASWLYKGPMVSATPIEMPDEEMEFNKIYRPHEYAELKLLQSSRREAEAKDQLRKELRKDQQLNFSSPEEMICIAFRTTQPLEENIIEGWKEHEELEYSKFCDRNMYFDNMRFLVHDMPIKSHVNYYAEYLSFMYSVLVIASNETPQSALAPSRLYRLECPSNDASLRELITGYDLKLKHTQDVIMAKENELKNKMRPRLSDKDANYLFCSHETIPVIVQDLEDMHDLYVSRHGIGLSADCPTAEDGEWSRKQRVSDRTFKRYMRQPRRAVEHAAVDFHQRKTVDTSEIGRLNKFQITDIREHTGEEEMKMSASKIRDVNDAAFYEKQIEKASHKVEEVIETRMSRKVTLLLGITVLGVSLLGMLPALFMVMKTNMQSVLITVLVITGSVLLMALCGFICLFFLKGKLRRAYSDYNGVMRNVVTDARESMRQYSVYLSHAVNMMRGYSILNRIDENNDPDSYQMLLLEKHHMDIEKARCELREIYGQYVEEIGIGMDDSDTNDYFDFDFSRPVDFSYPILFSAEDQTKITYLQNGNEAVIPVGFVDRIMARREDIYD